MSKTCPVCVQKYGFSRKPKQCWSCKKDACSKCVVSFAGLELAWTKPQDVCASCKSSLEAKIHRMMNPGAPATPEKSTTRGRSNSSAGAQSLDSVPVVAAQPLKRRSSSVVAPEGIPPADDKAAADKKAATDKAVADKAVADKAAADKAAADKAAADKAVADKAAADKAAGKAAAEKAAADKAAADKKATDKAVADKAAADKAAADKAVADKAAADKAAGKAAAEKAAADKAAADKKAADKAVADKAAADKATADKAAADKAAANKAALKGESASGSLSPKKGDAPPAAAASGDDDSGAVRATGTNRPRKPGKPGARGSITRADMKLRAEQAQEAREQEERELTAAVESSLSADGPTEDDTLPLKVATGTVRDKSAALAGVIPMSPGMGKGPTRGPRVGSGTAPAPEVVTHAGPQLGMQMGVLAASRGSLRSVKKDGAPPSAAAAVLPATDSEVDSSDETALPPAVLAAKQSQDAKDRRIARRSLALAGGTEPTKATDTHTADPDVTAAEERLAKARENLRPTAHDDKGKAPAIAVPTPGSSAASGPSPRTSSPRNAAPRVSPRVSNNNANRSTSYHAHTCPVCSTSFIEVAELLEHLKGVCGARVNAAPDGRVSPVPQRPPVPSVAPVLGLSSSSGVIASIAPKADAAAPPIASPGRTTPPPSSSPGPVRAVTPPPTSPGPGRATPPPASPPMERGSPLVSGNVKSIMAKTLASLDAAQARSSNRFDDKSTPQSPTAEMDQLIASARAPSPRSPLPASPRLAELDALIVEASSPDPEVVVPSVPAVVVSDVAVDVDDEAPVEWTSPRRPTTLGLAVLGAADSRVSSATQGGVSDSPEHTQDETPPVLSARSPRAGVGAAPSSAPLSARSYAPGEDSDEASTAESAAAAHEEEEGKVAAATSEKSPRGASAASGTADDERQRPLSVALRQISKHDSSASTGTRTSMHLVELGSDDDQDSSTFDTE